MSQWTHIRGGLELVSSPYEQKPMKIARPERDDFDNDEAYETAIEKWRAAFHKSFYLPYPEEQFKLSMPILGSCPDTKKKKNELGFYQSKPCLEFGRAYVYSLPRAKKYIEEAFNLLPQGELSLRYSVDQKITDSTSSCSGFMHDCLHKYYKQAVEKMYHSDDPIENWTFNELTKYCSLEKECMVESVGHILIGVRDDIRYCSGEELLKGLEACLSYLEKHDIDIEDGYLEWVDEYESKFIYAWRCSRLSSIHYQFFKLDRNTNKILWSKTYRHKRTPDGKLDYDATEWDIIEENKEYAEEDED